MNPFRSEYIFPISFDSDGVAKVNGEVKTVYSTNGDGALIPVRFTQDLDEVKLVYHPLNKSYIQYMT